MPPVGFEPTISAGERQQSYALDRAAKLVFYIHINLRDHELTNRLLVVEFKKKMQ
jgi:hypothetical protein